MSKKYKEAMDQLVVSDELRARILASTSERQKKSKHTRIFYIKRSIGYAACFMLCMGAVLANKGLFMHRDIPDTPSATQQVPILQSAEPQKDSGAAAEAVLPKSGRTESDAAVKNDGKARSADETAEAVTEQKPKTGAFSKSTESELGSVKEYGKTTAPKSSGYYAAPEQGRKKNNGFYAAAPNPQAAEKSSGNADGKHEDSIQEYMQNADERSSAADSFVRSGGGAAKLSSDDYEGAVGNALCASFNPFDAVREKVGYDFKIPTYVPDQYTMEDVSVVHDTVVQVSYISENDRLTYRTEKDGSNIKKSSGSDWDAGEEKTHSSNRTEESTEQKINNNEVTLSGDSDVYYSAEWNDGSSYSLKSDEGIEKDDMVKIVENVDYPSENSSSVNDNRDNENIQSEELSE